MNKKSPLLLAFLFFFAPSSHAEPDPVQLSVWVNEAIVATYTYNYKSYLEDQKRIAKYFSADGWIAYSNALNASKLPDAVQQNLYYVSAVATEPPVITTIDATHWQAKMGLLVVYKNPQYQQKQHLQVNINFMVAPSGQGVRGYSMSNLRALVDKTPCKCDIEADESIAQTPPATTSPGNAKQ